MKIQEVLDVEEHVWSPRFGLKGNVDLTIKTAFNFEGQEVSRIAPFEFKTGRNNATVAHSVQTALYTLLLGDRYGMLSKHLLMLIR